MDLLPAISAGLKVVGGLVSLVAGLTALYTPTQKDAPTQKDRLTPFGKGVLAALLIGALCSGGGALLDYLVKQSDDAKLKNLILTTEAARLTTSDATVHIVVSLDKSLPALTQLISKLDGALNYAKRNCRSPGRVTECKDYIIRAVIIDEIRFHRNSKLFPSVGSDPEAYEILTNIGAEVRFYGNKFIPSLDLNKNAVGALDINQNAIGGETLYEYDGVRLRLFINGKLPDEAFKTAGVLSIIDLLGKGLTATPFADGHIVCPKQSIEHDRDEHLLALLRAAWVEDVEFHFPHLHNIDFGRWEDEEKFRFGRSTDNLDIQYLHVNFPDEIKNWPIGEETR